MPHKDPVAKRQYLDGWAAANKESVLASHKRYNKKRSGKPGSRKRAKYNAAQRQRAANAKARKRQVAAKAVADALLAKAAERAASAIRQRDLYGGSLNPGRI